MLKRLNGEAMVLLNQGKARQGAQLLGRARRLVERLQNVPGIASMEVLTMNNEACLLRRCGPLAAAL